MKFPRHVVITGVSSGFGFLMAQNFLRRGWTVHGTSRTGEIDRSSISDGSTRKLCVYPLDLESKESVTQFASQLLKAAPQIDVLINNAGYGLFGAMADLSETQIRRQREVNFLGPVFLTKSLLPRLLSCKGHIINFSSLLGFSGLPLTSLYCASKFAVEGWSEALKYELAPHGVRVTVIQPGAHRTKFGFNVEWGQNTFSNDSPFYRQSLNYRRLLEKLRTRENPSPPDAVANKVCQIAGLLRPPFRVQIGKDVRVTHLLRRLLPLRFFMNVTDRVYRRIFLAPVETV